MVLTKWTLGHQNDSSDAHQSSETKDVWLSSGFLTNAMIQCSLTDMHNKTVVGGKVDEVHLSVPVERLGTCTNQQKLNPIKQTNLLNISVDRERERPVHTANKPPNISPMLLLTLLKIENDYDEPKIKCCELN